MDYLLSWAFGLGPFRVRSKLGDDGSVGCALELFGVVMGCLLELVWGVVEFFFVEILFAPFNWASDRRRARKGLPPKRREWHTD